MADDVLLVSSDGGVRTLTLHRPEAKNAIGPVLAARMLEALRQAEQDPTVRVIVVRGEGGTFSAGGDVKDMLTRQGRPLETKARQEQAFGALARALLTLPKPVIAHVNGDAYGAGLALAMACDLSYAHADARLGLTFSRLALGPDTGVSWMLPRLVGLPRAKELLFLGDVLSGEEAAKLGMVNHAGAPDAVAARVAEVATRLADGPTSAYALQKQALLRGAAADLDNALATEANLQAYAFTLDDHREGVQAFLDKRAPRFRGT